jgi:hypothetical protein
MIAFPFLSSRICLKLKQLSDNHERAKNIKIKFAELFSQILSYKKSELFI